MHAMVSIILSLSYCKKCCHNNIWKHLEHFMVVNCIWLSCKQERVESQQYSVGRLRSWVWFWANWGKKRQTIFSSKTGFKLHITSEKKSNLHSRGAMWKINISVDIESLGLCVLVLWCAWVLRWGLTPLHPTSVVGAKREHSKLYLTPSLSSMRIDYVAGPPPNPPI